LSLFLNKLKLSMFLRVSVMMNEWMNEWISL